MRIAVMGHSGSGKTTLAKKISEKLSIPHIHLDRFYFEAGGKMRLDTTEGKRREGEMRSRALVELTKPAWVSDGFYIRILPEIGEMADTVIILDIALWRRLLNHAKRSTDRSARHKELSLRHDLLFFFEMIWRTFKGRHKIDNLVAAYKDKIVVLKSFLEIDQYTSNLK